MRISFSGSGARFHRRDERLDIDEMVPFAAERRIERIFLLPGVLNTLCCATVQVRRISS
jgi:hypothetical protein